MTFENFILSSLPTGVAEGAKRGDVSISVSARVVEGHPVIVCGETEFAVHANNLFELVPEDVAPVTAADTDPSSDEASGGAQDDSAGGETS